MPRRSSPPLRCPNPVRSNLALELAWAILLIGPGCSPSPTPSTPPSPVVNGKTLVVYCAHDALYADPILERFTQETGIAVQTRHDTEATKSLGLVNRLIREKAARTCDVFWNNQVLGTTDLLAHDLLVPYRGSGWKRIPDRFKDPRGRWCGFAARLRVWIVNTDRLAATATAIEQGFAAADLSRMAIARPLFGTTLTHYCLLWHVDDGRTLKAMHADTRRRGLIEVAGNATVKNLVARGTCDLGWTDSDDFFVGIDDGRPVAMQPIRLPGGSTICLPNSVAIIKGTRQMTAAQRLVDFLLSSEIELALARSPSRQIPLGPTDQGQLPEDVRHLVGWASEGIELSGLTESRAACLAWLRAEYDR